MNIKPLAQRPVWKALAAHYKELKQSHLRSLFADDPKRGQRLSVEAAGLFLDYSKNRVTDRTLKLLLQLTGPRAGGSRYFGRSRRAGPRNPGSFIPHSKAAPDSAW